uniref:Uncharacterized protein n=1 Tax=Eptatretus burgeri TaxID=7764 RepID=A0A8C4NGJ1_EPTBU
MAQPRTQEKIREKISAVRAVVGNKSNNEIILVLQQFDNNVDKTVQAFMDGSAAEVLSEWSTPMKKKTIPRNKNRKITEHKKDDNQGAVEMASVSLNSQFSPELEAELAQPSSPLLNGSASDETSDLSETLGELHLESTTLQKDESKAPKAIVEGRRVWCLAHTREHCEVFLLLTIVILLSRALLLSHQVWSNDLLWLHNLSGCDT